MKREVLFRGKRKDNGKWIEGYFVKTITGKSFILTGNDEDVYKSINALHGEIFTTQEFFEVIPETVGQYIGLKYKNGKKIFEGMRLKNNFMEGVVIWDEISCAFKLDVISSTTDIDKAWFPLKGMKSTEIIED